MCQLSYMHIHTYIYIYMAQADRKRKQAGDRPTAVLSGEMPDISMLGPYANSDLLDVLAQQRQGRKEAKAKAKDKQPKAKAQAKTKAKAKTKGKAKAAAKAKQAPMYTVATVVALECYVTSEAPQYARVLAWVALLMVYCSMRADDVQGVRPETMQLTSAGFRAKLGRTKTTGPDRRSKEVQIFVHRTAGLSGNDWLKVGFELWGKCPLPVLILDEGMVLYSFVSGKFFA